MGVSERIPLKELVNRLHEPEEGRMRVLLRDLVADGEGQTDDGTLEGKKDAAAERLEAEVEYEHSLHHQ